jgi:hypothetical protein
MREVTRTCTIEEREEFGPRSNGGHGLCGRITKTLRAAEESVIVWMGITIFLSSDRL